MAGLKQKTDRGMPGFCWGSGVPSGHIITLPQAHSSSLHPPAQNKLYSINPFLPNQCIQPTRAQIRMFHNTAPNQYMLSIHFTFNWDHDVLCWCFCFFFFLHSTYADQTMWLLLYTHNTKEEVKCKAHLQYSQMKPACHKRRPYRIIKGGCFHNVFIFFFFFAKVPPTPSSSLRTFSENKEDP